MPPPIRGGGIINKRHVKHSLLGEGNYYCGVEWQDWLAAFTTYNECHTIYKKQSTYLVLYIVEL